MNNTAHRTHTSAGPVGVRGKKRKQKLRPTAINIDLNATSLPKGSCKNHQFLAHLSEGLSKKKIVYKTCLNKFSKKSHCTLKSESHQAIQDPGLGNPVPVQLEDTIPIVNQTRDPNPGSSPVKLDFPIIPSQQPMGSIEHDGRGSGNQEPSV